MNLPSHLPAFIPPMTQCRETAKKAKAPTVSRNCFTAKRFYTALVQLAALLVPNVAGVGSARNCRKQAISPLESRANPG